MRVTTSKSKNSESFYITKGPAGPVKSEPVINRLQEKVSALIKLLAVVIQLPVGMERDKDRPGLI